MRQNCTGKNILQCCLNIPCTTLHRLNKIPAQCCPWSSWQHCTRNILLILVLIPLEQHCTGQNPMQCFLRGYGQLTTGKNPVQCCLNTPGTILHRKNPQYCLRRSRQHCTGKNTRQCLLNTIWSLWGNFYFGPVNFLISGCSKCHTNIVAS